MPENESQFMVEPTKLPHLPNFMAYEIDEEGYLIDTETGNRVKNSRGEAVPMDEVRYVATFDEGFALISEHTREVEYHSDHQEFDVDEEYVYEYKN